MSDRLTALDATFLELEEADLTAHMHIGAILVFEPLPEGGAPSAEELGRHLLERLPALPRYMCRLSPRRTGGLTWPVWEPDPRFDIAAHVRRAALPAPGGREQLLEFAGEYWSARLDRARPLWEVVVVEGLESGGWALCTKTHHCLVDGVGSIDASHLLLDVDADSGPAVPDLAPEPLEPERAAPWPLGAVHSGLHAGAEAVRAGVHAVLHPSDLLEAVDRSRGLVEVIVRDELKGAPSCGLNVPLGTRRRFDAVTIPLERLKEIKRALGGTVNDVVLAAVAGGLRRLLLGRNEEPPLQGLRAMVPVNIRAVGDEMALGNRISSLFVELPVAEPDPLRRYRLAAGAAEELKGGLQALGSDTLLRLAGQAPPVIHSVLARSLFATRLFNVTVTNVPGPQLPLYAFGARMTEVLPLVPLAAEHAVGVAVLSYNGSVSFGLNADYDAVPDLGVLRAGLEQSLEELSELAGVGCT